MGAQERLKLVEARARDLKALIRVLAVLAGERAELGLQLRELDAQRRLALITPTRGIQLVQERVQRPREALTL